MGFFDFFRKEKEEKEEARKIKLEELEPELGKEIEKLEAENESSKAKIDQIIKSLGGRLKTELKDLKMVNLEPRKENEKIKQVVQENVQYYISHVEKLISDFGKVDSSLKYKEYAASVEKILKNFAISSNNSFEKATILVGKEMAQIRDTLKSSIKEFNGISQANEGVVGRTETLKKLIDMKKEYDKNLSVRKNLEDSLERLKEDRERFNKELAKLKIEHEEFKKSSEFKEFAETREKLRKELEELNRKIQGIKEKIDLRQLLKNFHSEPRKTKVLKEYNENFIKALENDEKLEILGLLKQPDSEEVAVVRGRVQEIRKEAEKFKENIGEKFEKSIRDTSFKLSEIDNQIENEKKKVLKFEEKANELKSTLLSKVKESGNNLEISQ